MRILQVIFIVLLALFFLENLCTVHGEEDDCRSVIWKPKVFNRSLHDRHVIKRQSVQNMDQCQILCFIEPSCVSTNYDLESGVEQNCELSSSNEDKDPGSLENRPGFIHQAMKNNCIGKVCTPSNKTCQSGYGRHGYRCVCPVCTRGKNCEKYNKDAVLFFQDKSTSNTVIVEKSFHLTKFTIGMWLQVDQGSNEHTPYSFATSSSFNELYLEFKDKNIEISIKGNDTSIPMNFSFIDGNWQHICLTWENTAGLWILYKDGRRLTSGNLSVGSTIEEGVLVLGQEQDSYKGGFQGVQSFQGNMTKFNIWNRVLSGDEVSDLVKKCPSGEGNVVKWTELIPQRSLSVKSFCGKSCHP